MSESNSVYSQVSQHLLIKQEIKENCKNCLTIFHLNESAWKYILIDKANSSRDFLRLIIEVSCINYSEFISDLVFNTTLIIRIQTNNPFSLFQMLQRNKSTSLALQKLLERSSTTVTKNEEGPYFHVSARLDLPNKSNWAL